MQHLTTVEQFNALLTSGTRFIVWCSAAWCKPCQRMDKDVLVSAIVEKGIPIYYCDDTVNPQVIAVCGIKTFPTFCYFKGGVQVGSRNSADAAKVGMWIRSL